MDLAYPEVGDSDSGFFLVTEAGTFKDITYEEHDWLVYIANSDNKWFRLKGVAIVTDNLTAINKPNPGWYPKVRLDNNGNVIDATDLSADDLPSHTHEISDINGLSEYLDSNNEIATYDSSGIKIEEVSGVKTLSVKIDEDTIIKDLNGNLMVNPDIVASIVDGTSGGNTCANHTHTASQITDLTNAVTTILKESGLLTLDVLNIPIDEETIIVNEAGQLTSVASALQKHTHTIADITDLDPELLVWATCQKIVAKDSTVDLDAGKYLLSTLRLDQALAAMSLDLKSFETKLTSLEEKVTNRIPPLPDRLKDIANISTSSVKVRLLDDLEKELTGYKSVRIKTNAFYIIPTEEDSGSISLYDNDTLVSTINIGIPTVGKDLGDTGFNIISTEDPYLGIPEYEGFYTSYAFAIDYTPSTSGMHSLKLVQNFKGSNFESNVIDIPFYTNFTATVTLESSELPTANHYVSGVPVVKEYPEFWYQTTIAGLPQVVPTEFFNSFINNVVQESPIYTVNGNTIIYEKAYVDLSKYSDIVSIASEVVNFNGDTFNDVLNIPRLRIDTSTVESYRVRAKTTQDISELEATDYMDVFTPSDMLSNFEAQVINDVGVIPTDNFTNINGPDYTDYDTDNSSDNADIVWITFRFDSHYINNLAMTLVPTSSEFLLNKDGTLKGIELYVGQSSSSYLVNKWVNANKPFDGYSGNTDYHFNGLDLFRSSQTERVATFGQNEITDVNYVFVRLGFSKSVDLKVFVDSILESLKRYN